MPVSQATVASPPVRIAIAVALAACSRRRSFVANAPCLACVNVCLVRAARALPLRHPLALAVPVPRIHTNAECVLKLYKKAPQIKLILRGFFMFMMRVEGLEPPRRETPDPKSGASANSAIRARGINGETCRIRTYDTLIKSQVLYQLS
jgi:hypothetical protein